LSKDHQVTQVQWRNKSAEILLFDSKELKKTEHLQITKLTILKKLMEVIKSGFRWNVKTHTVGCVGISTGPTYMFRKPPNLRY
jgi:hypothetical protein